MQAKTTLTRTAHLLMLATLLASSAACVSTKTTSAGVVGIDRKQSMSPLVSSNSLNQGAVKAYTQVLTKEKAAGNLNTDPAMTRRVKAIAQRLIPQATVFRADAKNWDWKVNVIKSDQVNAWCMPGGKIAFYSGIIEKLKLTDDEIAAIMGHEIAHALREHSRERASEQATSSLLIAGAGAALGAGQTALNMTKMAYNTVFTLKHSRLHETESDRIGVELSARGGYNPNAAVTLWQKMSRASGGKSGPEFLSTHPSPNTRIADLKNYAAKVMPLYQQSRR